jgi:hypothetical protein
VVLWPVQHQRARLKRRHFRHHLAPLRKFNNLRNDDPLKAVVTGAVTQLRHPRNFRIAVASVGAGQSVRLIVCGGAGKRAKAKGPEPTTALDIFEAIESPHAARVRATVAKLEKEGGS